MDIELKDFVSEALKQIIEGIVVAQEFAKAKHTAVVPTDIYYNSDSPNVPEGILGGGDSYTNLINFDIAVTASDALQKKSGLGVFITVIGSSLQSQEDVSNSSVSRIKFTVPVLFPRQSC